MPESRNDFGRIAQPGQFYKIVWKWNIVSKTKWFLLHLRTLCEFNRNSHFNILMQL